MTDSILNDVGLTAAKIALDGLARRSDAIGRNLANVDTPGYRAQTVSFEKAVKIAITESDNLNVQTTHERHISAIDQLLAMSSQFRPGGSLRADGNNVDVDVEMVDMTEATTRYETITKYLSKKYSLLKEIANSR